MNRGRASMVAGVSFVLALLTGLGAGMYWAWWNAREKQVFVDSNPAGPWIALGSVSVVCLVISVVVGLLLLLTNDE